MINKQASNDQDVNNGEGTAEGFAISPPAVSLPKGGGAIRGIDEKFQVNPATGSGTMTVPITISLARQGSGPQLALSCDSKAMVGLDWTGKP